MTSLPQSSTVSTPSVDSAAAAAVGRGQPRPAWTTFRACAPERVDRIIEALRPNASTVILVGEYGVGKFSLASEAVAELAQRAELPSTVVIVRSEAELTPEAVESLSVEGERFLVLEGIDSYGAGAAATVERMAGTPGFRIVATARRIRGGATRLASRIGVRRVAVPALSLKEAERYLCLLLGSEGVDSLTLRRWYRWTAGNFTSLTMLAPAVEEAGALGRRHGLVWDQSAGEHVPAEFAEDLLRRCSADELATLQLVAAAEPIREEPLQALLPPGHLARLMDQGFLTVERRDTGGTRVAFKQPLHAMVVKEQTCPVRLREINRNLYETLSTDLGRRDPTASGGKLARMVDFGLGAGLELPVDWLFAALNHQVAMGTQDDLCTRICLAIAAHKDANSTQLAKAAIWAAVAARFTGDKELAAAAQRWGLRAEASRRPMVGAPDRLYCALQVRLATYEAADLGELEAARRRLTALEEGARHATDSVRLSVRSALTASRAAAGRLDSIDEGGSQDARLLQMPVERARFWSEVAAALVLAQRGKFAEATSRSEVAATMMGLGGAAHESNAELLGFCTFLSYWFSGASELAQDAMDQLRTAARSGQSKSGLVELAEVLQATAVGRWQEVERRAHVLILRLTDHDPYVMRPLARAALALALAGLGQRSASLQAIRIAETARFGVSQMARGMLLTLTLRARVWNHAPDTEAAARDVANWAAADRLPMVELVAIHVRGLANSQSLPQLLPRLELLAAEVDSPVAEVVRQHCQELATQQPAWETPAARMLASFGAWMPLPASPQLSAREREISLLAALGYSSKWIAEHHHLSVRTVETHLRHVFAKIGTTNRDELRGWFRRESSGQ
ncbi:MAG: response regulator transcription factor [Galactobacter sp.]